MLARLFPCAAMMSVVMVLPAAGIASQAPPPAPPAQSAAASKELTDLLTTKKITSIAAKDPSEPGRYMAALSVPGVELLVVSAKADPVELDYRLYQHDYVTAYSDLNSGVSSTAKVFITDQNGDGLVARPAKGVPLDSIAEDGKEFAFDGDLKRLKSIKMTPEEYDKRVADADGLYTHILTMLIAELKKG